MLRTQQLVVGIFRHDAQAEQAINELRQVGFDNRHVRFAKHGISIDKILKKFINSCEGQKPLANSIYDDLVNMGMPPEEAHYYQSEFEAGHTIVAVLKSGVPLVATSILTRNGSHIVNQHLAQPTDHSQSTDQSAPTSIVFLKCLLKRAQSTIKRFLATNQPISEQETARHTYAELNSAQEHTTPSAANARSTRVQEHSTRDVNAELNSTNGHIAPSTDYDNTEATERISRDLMKEKISKGLVKEK